MKKVSILWIVVFVFGSLFATEYFVDPNNEYIYAVLDGFETSYDESDASLSVFNEQLNIVINIMKLSEPAEGLELSMISEEIGKNLEQSGFQIVAVNDRNFREYVSKTFECTTTSDGISVRVEFTIFEVPVKGFYLIIVAAPDETYDEFRTLLLNAKQMIMFIE
ncbi:hypothetical protein [Thermotoga profunda]|uniref:hypothetical protein n=1 Tax=Thermotoga profunda TaxID=1508420 RepID=UPI000596B62A|nr:hypothetical protein [Thermotoga profunda]